MSSAAPLRTPPLVEAHEDAALHRLEKRHRVHERVPREHVLDIGQEEARSHEDRVQLVLDGIPEPSQIVERITGLSRSGIPRLPLLADVDAARVHLEEVHPALKPLIQPSVQVRDDRDALARAFLDNADHPPPVPYRVEVRGVGEVRVVRHGDGDESERFQHLHHLPHVPKGPEGFEVLIEADERREERNGRIDPEVAVEPLGIFRDEAVRPLLPTEVGEGQPCHRGRQAPVALAAVTDHGDVLGEHQSSSRLSVGG